MITGVQGVIVEVNPAFERIYGYSRAEAIGATPRLLRDASSTPELYRAMWKDILDPEKGFWKGEIINRRKDGTRVPVLLSITPIRDHEGRTTHYMGLAIDISEKRALEAKINRQQREYGAFLRHEMRNMLATVTGYIELVLHHSGETPPLQQKYLEAAQNSVLATLNIINALRELEHYELGRIPLDRQQVRLHDLIASAVAQLEPLQQQAGVGLQIQAEEQNDILEVDAAKMEAVFHNLIKNAVEHIAGIPGEGVVVRIEEKGGQLAVAITNRGAPIPPERLATFFDRFNTTKKESGGTGLGTTYAELITRAHGGDIRVSSSAEEGTTVTVVLPRMKTDVTIQGRRP